MFGHFGNEPQESLPAWRAGSVTLVGVGCKLRAEYQRLNSRPGPSSLQGAQRRNGAQGTEHIVLRLVVGIVEATEFGLPGRLAAAVLRGIRTVRFSRSQTIPKRRFSNPQIAGYLSVACKRRRATTAWTACHDDSAAE